MEEFINLVKDYGAVAFGFISSLGIGGAIAAVIKVKEVLNKVKETTNKALATKEKASSELDTAVALVKEQNKQIEMLSNDVNKLKGEIRK